MSELDPSTGKIVFTFKKADRSFQPSKGSHFEKATQCFIGETRVAQIVGGEIGDKPWIIFLYSEKLPKPVKIKEPKFSTEMGARNWLLKAWPTLYRRFFADDASRLLSPRRIIRGTD